MRLYQFCPALILGFFVMWLLGSIEAAGAEAPKLPKTAVGKVDFGKEIQPIFEKTCYECHGSEKQKAGLRLDQKADALKGGESGPVLVPRKSAESLLIQAVTGSKE